MLPPAVPIRRQLPFPSRFHDLPPAEGYQELHTRYMELKNHFLAQTHADLSVDRVAVKFMMKTWVSNRKILMVAVCVFHRFFLTFSDKHFNIGRL
jgi:hypothetical protein